MFKIEREDSGNVTILRVSGELDFENTVQLRGELYGIMKENRFYIVINMSRVDIISSYTVGVFVAFARDIRQKSQNKGDIKFAGVQGRARDTFATTRIDHILELFEEEEEAIASFGES